MIIARSPLRISFAGGGTDIPAFYQNYGPGVVVSTSINKYVYVTLNEKFGGGVSLRYRVHENAESAEKLRHPLIKQILLNYGVTDSVEIVISSDVPARGSGLGASSALACALIAALDRFTGQNFKPDNDNHKVLVAELGAHIEIEKVGSPIGKQDHYASALGGFNRLDFLMDGTVKRTKFLSDEFLEEIESQSMLFYLNIEHKYAQSNDGEKKESFVQHILRDQVEAMDKNHHIYELQRDNAVRLWEHMAYEVPERFIDHVNENWRIKRQSHPDTSSKEIDAIIQKAYAAGATAAKVCGAGGGGFVYLVVPPSMQNDVRDALKLHELKFKFEKKGVEVIFDGIERNAVAVH